LAEVLQYQKIKGLAEEKGPCLVVMMEGIFTDLWVVPFFVLDPERSLLMKKGHPLSDP
jgi:hypothetical protein